MLPDPAPSASFHLKVPDSPTPHAVDHDVRPRMIDRVARTQLAEAIRAFAAGPVTSDDFEASVPFSLEHEAVSGGRRGGGEPGEAVKDGADDGASGADGDDAHEEAAARTEAGIGLVGFHFSSDLKLFAIVLLLRASSCCYKEDRPEGLRTFNTIALRRRL